MTSEIKETHIIPVSEAILAVVASFLLSTFLAALIATIFNYGIAMVIGELLLTVAPLGYMLSKKIEIKKYIGLKINSKSILLGIAIGIFLVYFDALVTFILTSIFGPSKIIEESNKIITDMSRSVEGLILVTATLISAGICEEFTFRGFLQTTISNRYPSWAALIVSALAFGFIHFDPQGIYTISAFLMGLALGFVYYYWHSYILSATAHMTLNLVVLALSLLMR